MKDQTGGIACLHLDRRGLRVHVENSHVEINAIGRCVKDKLILGTVAKLEGRCRGSPHGNGGVLGGQRNRIHVNVQQVQIRLGTQHNGWRRRVQCNVACRR